MKPAQTDRSRVADDKKDKKKKDDKKSATRERDKESRVSVSLKNGASGSIVNHNEENPLSSKASLNIVKQSITAPVMGPSKE